MTTPETPPADAAPPTDAQRPALPDPRGPDELKAGRRLEEAWDARRRKAEREARAKHDAAFWEAVEARNGAGSSPDGENVTSITARRRSPRR
jgi:hypothetical protein